MPLQVTIYGKDTWHYTTNAREDYARKGYKVDYYRVDRDPAKLEEMLTISDNRRSVPVIIDAGKVTIGYGGSWGV